MKSAVTVSLVEEARGGPFVFWDSLDVAFQSAANLGFDAVEIFAPGPSAIDIAHLKQLCSTYSLQVAAFGTGAGMVKLGLSLTDADANIRQKARDFIASMIHLGANFGAPAIIGSMQGRWSASVSRDQAMSLLAESLHELGSLAAEHSLPLLYEPLNRYETNLAKTIAEGCDLLREVQCEQVKLLADLFHMNIEEADLGRSIVAAGDRIGHVHFVDSNRRAAGMGHIDFSPVIQALREIGYKGFLSAEAFALPDSETAARTTIETLRSLVPS